MCDIKAVGTLKREKKTKMCHARPDIVVPIPAPRNSYCVPKNPRQHVLEAYLNDPLQKIVIATGPAGTGKTLLVTQAAIRGLLAGKYEKLIFTRPSVGVDEELGFLPGTLEEKMAPWMRPLYDILHAHITPKEVSQWMDEKIIEICPLGFMRGRTFKRCCIVADEMQNCTMAQMKLVLTRIGEHSRLFVTGDLEQCDRIGCRNGLDDFLDKIRGRRSDSISSVEFDIHGIEREPVVKEVLEIYKGNLRFPVEPSLQMEHPPYPSSQSTDSNEKVSKGTAMFLLEEG